MQTVFFQEERLMNTEFSPYDDNRKVIIIERETGIGWAAAFIVLAIAIGFGVIMFMDQQTMIEYKIDKAIQNMETKSAEATGIAEVQIPSRDGLTISNDSLIDADSAEVKSSMPKKAASLNQRLTH